MTVAPELLRAAGTRLDAVADELRQRLDGIDLVPDAPSWSGAAAGQAAVRSAEVRGATAALSDVLHRLADDVSRAAERTGAAVERLEVARVRAADATRPELHAAAEHEAAAAAQELVRRGQELVDALRTDPLALLPAWLASSVAAVQTGMALNDARGAAARAKDYRTWVDRLRRHDVGTRVERMARQRFLAGSWWQTSRFVPRPAWLDAVAPVASRTFLPLAVVGGVRDAVGGGGYDGARGATTRVLGGAAAVAGVALLVGVGAPAVAAVAGGVLVAHALWSAGNAVWDRRQQIGAWLGRAGRVVASGARTVGSGLRGAARSVRDGVRAAVDTALRSIVGPGRVGWT